MGGEINTLGHHLNTLSESNRHTRDFTLGSLIKALMEVIAHFPVYRTYTATRKVADRDRQYIEYAVAKARRRNPAMSASIFTFIEDVLLLRFYDSTSGEEQEQWLDFVMKFQQLTGPVMAKGLEDTAFYVYNRLVALNEVGGMPERFGLTMEAFHGQNIERSRSTPLALLATSTHDTKRSEDVRSRISVLSEDPAAWHDCLLRWSRLNRGRKVTVQGVKVPDRNEEYLLYQTIVGAWPTVDPTDEEHEGFIGRIREYLLKAMREAKVNTSWINPNPVYEEAALHFVDAILRDVAANGFLADLRRTLPPLIRCGLLNSLSQTLLKTTSPGIPDFYQGTELWDFSLVDPANHRVLAFLRRHGDDVILVVANLSRFAQAVSLDLKEFAGIAPEDLFSRNRFPVVREAPYPLTLGPHDHFWFLLRRRETVLAAEGELPRIRLRGGLPWWEALRHARGDTHLEGVTTAYLKRCAWFRGAARAIIGYGLRDTVLLRQGETVFPLFFLEVRYQDGPPETYLIPVAFLTGVGAKRVAAESPQAAIAALAVGDEEGILCDAVHDREFRNALLALALGRRQLHGERDSLIVPIHAGGGRIERVEETDHPISELPRAEGTNSIIVYGDRHVLKLYRRVEPGIHSEVEMARFLSAKSRCPNVAPFRGSLELRHAGAEPSTIGLLQGYVQNQGDGWRLSLHLLDQYFERLVSRCGELPPPPERFSSLLDGSACAVPEPAADLIGGFYLEMAGLLGRRTAELHLALATGGTDPAWRPEEYSTLYQRAVYQSMRNQARRSLQLLAQRRQELSPEEQEAAERILAAEKEILSRLRLIVGRRIGAMKIRIHGNFTLGKVLFTGKDFMIIDFEGEPDRTFGERRIKRSPLRDVASMIRSFHNATLTALVRHGNGHPGDLALLEPWAEACYYHVSCRYLSGYRERMGASPLVPADRGDLETLLRSFLLDKALYELGYTLVHRPGRVALPLRGVETVLEGYQ